MLTDRVRPSPPYIWTLGRYQRVAALHETAPGKLRQFVAHCPLCGLPALQVKPARTGRTWAGHCDCCGAQTFAGLPRLLYAPTSLLSAPRSRGTEHLGGFVAGLLQMGASEARIGRWERVQHGTDQKVEFSRPQGCLACGEGTSASVRRDRYGLAYLVCSACRTRVFTRSEHTLEMALGWTVWLHRTGSGEAWFDAYRTGEGLWGLWLKGHRIEEQVEPEQRARINDEEVAR